MNKDLPIIDFSFNWNGKLYCDVFTVIRMRDDNLFQTGAKFVQTLKFEPLGVVEILEIKHFTISQLTDFMAFIEYGVNRKEAIKLIYEQFQVDPANTELQFSYILLRRKKIETTITQ